MISGKTLQAVGFPVSPDAQFEKVLFIFDRKIVATATNGKQLQQKKARNPGARLQPIVGNNKPDSSI